MTLLATFKSDLLFARKSKDEVAKNLLTALVGEATAVSKNSGDRETTDDECIATVKKFIKGAEETRNIMLSGGRDTTLVEKEVQLLMKYVPVQMTETSLLATLKDYQQKNPGAKLGEAMRYLKDNFSGYYDGRLASTVAKDVFK